MKCNCGASISVLSISNTSTKQDGGGVKKLVKENPVNVIGASVLNCAGTVTVWILAIKPFVVVRVVQCNWFFSARSHFET